jgi:hypothetical protein
LVGSPEDASIRFRSINIGASNWRGNVLRGKVNKFAGRFNEIIAERASFPSRAADQRAKARRSIGKGPPINRRAGHR